jgi:hypothetical protein
MSIEIKGVTKEEVAFDKYIQFTYEGESYSVLLHWDKWDGYDLTFIEVAEPKWVSEWEDSQQYGGESLEYTLDGLTDEVLESEGK